MDSVFRTADKYADNRMMVISKGNNRIKLGSRDIKNEMVMASVFGELSALERIMAEIVDDQEITRADIEGKLHLAIVDLYNFIRNKFGDGLYQMRLEDYLALRGYYKKTAGSLVVEQ